MSTNEETIRALREAIEVSPENLPLRKHLADLLLDIGNYKAAETEYRQALAMAPGDSQLKLNLAEVFYRLAKNSAALVILEELTTQSPQDAAALILYARILLKTGDMPQAEKAYQQAVQTDPTLFDEELENTFGSPDTDGPEEDDDSRIKLPADEFAFVPANDVEQPLIDFSEVGGMDKLKEEIRMKIIHPLEHPEIYAAYGKPVGGGILMYGPPGCGKTYLARATAGEINANFMSVGLHDVLNMYLGQSESNLHELFELARSSTPCVLFFDEVDALGASRTDFRHSAGRQLINQFLAELDGMNAVNEGLLILAATNAPWHLDSAFRRPGRFDRIIFVPPPDAAARHAILKILMKDKPQQEIDFKKISQKTDGFSGADLKAIIDVAVEAKLTEAMKKGIPSPIVTKDLLSAAKTLNPTTKEWFATARNYALYSNQSGIYDDILAYLKL